MPIYEYRCASCGFEKEYLQKLSDAPITTCEQCGKPSMTKLISAAGFQLKGSGWYVTDFKNNDSKKNGGKDKSAAKDGKESKPDAAASDSSTASAAEPKTSSETKTGDTKAGDTKVGDAKATAPSTGSGSGSASVA